MRIRASGNQIEIQAPAKVNLFLEILGRREDGFHELETVITSVSLFDTLCFHPRQDSQICIHNSYGPEWPKSVILPTDDRNLIYRAFDAVRQRLAHSSFGVDIQIAKRIPVEAGLGGGSSDAAAAIVAANHLMRGNLSREQMVEIGATIGSDVPFFFYGGTSVCRGRGEKVSRIEVNAGIPIVLAKPDTGLSTRQVFQQIDATSYSHRSPDRLLNKLSSGQLLETGKEIFNRLQAAASRLNDSVGKLATAFSKTNCLGHQMSGSGTTYFGIFSSPRTATIAANCLSNQYRHATIFACETLSAAPINPRESYAAGKES